MRGFDCEWTIGHLVKGRRKRVRVGTDPLPATASKAAPAARVSAANALLDRGYGKPPQHITGEVAASYVARLPTPAVDVTEWTKSLTDVAPTLPPPEHGPDGEDKT
jgi:hypothetical protein